MSGSHLTIPLLAGALLITGCSSGFNQDPGELIAACDFQAALPLLEKQCQDNPGDLKWRRLKGIALMAEGRTDEGYAALRPEAGNDAGYHHSSEAALTAARYIIREQDRAVEAARLLDSALIWNGDLKGEVQKLAWDRAVEYLGSGSEAGYRLMRFVMGHDPTASGRLRAGHKELAKRYDEWTAVDSELAKLASRVKAYTINKGQSPANLDDLNRGSLIRHPPFRHGWNVSLQRIQGVPSLVAEAERFNSGGIPTGSRMAMDIGGE